MRRVVINGMFYAQRATGVQRYARELMLELDKLVPKGGLELVVPFSATDVPSFANLRVIRCGSSTGALWEQVDLRRFLRKNGCVAVSLCNSAPLLRPGIMCIHDAAYKTHPEFFKTAFGKASVAWHRTLFWLAAHSGNPIITVSHFSKYSLIDAYGIDPKRLWVIQNGWQHMLRVTPDEGALQRFGLTHKGYYFTLGNINYNKNTRWVIEYALRHPDEQFVLTGVRSKNSKVSIEEAKNVTWLGYLRDEEIAALYRHCKAFIFPSIHEGFGIPPMEALSQGAPIIIADATVLPEIYRGAAHYIDPYDTNVELDAVLSERVDTPSAVLDRYSWEESARRLWQLITTFEEEGRA